VKKIIVVVAIAMGLLGAAGAASADPTVTLCHDIEVNVGGNEVVNDAACNVLPPQ